MYEERRRNEWNSVLEWVCLMPKGALARGGNVDTSLVVKGRQIPGKWVLSGPWFLACDRGTRSSIQSKESKGLRGEHWDCGTCGQFGKKREGGGSSGAAALGVGSGLS